MTKTSYILIDYENVHLKDLESVPKVGWNVAVFLGSQQSRESTPWKVGEALKRLSRDSGFLHVEHKGDNALDFVLAYYVGVISEKNPTAAFYIVARDTGYDALIEHLKGKGIVAQRCAQFADIPLFAQPESPFAAAEKSLLEKAIEDLIRRKEKKPGTLEKLQSALCSRFKLSLPETTALINDLKSFGLIQIKKQKITYLRELDFHSSASKAA